MGRMAGLLAKRCTSAKPGGNGGVGKDEGRKLKRKGDVTRIPTGAAADVNNLRRLLRLG